LREAYGGAWICAKEIPRLRGARRLTGSNAAPDFPAAPDSIMRCNINKRVPDTQSCHRFFAASRADPFHQMKRGARSELTVERLNDRIVMIK
jgi:hypothetical protein